MTQIRTHTSLLCTNNEWGRAVLPAVNKSPLSPRGPRGEQARKNSCARIHFRWQELISSQNPSQVFFLKLVRRPPRTRLSPPAPAPRSPGRLAGGAPGHASSPPPSTAASLLTEAVKGWIKVKGFRWGVKFHAYLQRNLRSGDKPPPASTLCPWPLLPAGAHTRGAETDPPR